MSLMGQILFQLLHAPSIILPIWLPNSITSFKTKQRPPLRWALLLSSSRLVEVEALGAIEVALDAALRGLDELLAVDDDVGNLLV